MKAHYVYSKYMCVIIISKTFNDYDNDYYYTCNKISKHFHNQTQKPNLERFIGLTDINDV